MSKGVSEWFGLCNVSVASYLTFPSALGGREGEVPQCTDGITEVPRRPGREAAFPLCGSLTQRFRNLGSKLSFVFIHNVAKKPVLSPFTAIPFLSAQS